MPVWLRKFVYKEIYDFYEKEKTEYEKSVRGREQITEKTDLSTISRVNNSIKKAEIPEFVSKIKNKTK